MRGVTSMVLVLTGCPAALLGGNDDHTGTLPFEQQPEYAFELQPAALIIGATTEIEVVSEPAVDPARIEGLAFEDDVAIELEAEVVEGVYTSQVSTDGSAVTGTVEAWVLLDDGGRYLVEGGVELLQAGASPDRRTAMIVDAWAQHPTPAFVAHPMFASLRRWMGIGDDIPELPLELTVAAMDAAGVDHALLSGWWGPGGPLISNDEVAEAVGRFPDRFSGVCSVDLRRPMDAVRELRRRVGEGFKGVRVLPWLWELPPDHRRYYPIYAACVDLGVPFCLQVGHTGPLMPSEPGRPIPYLDRVALDFPELVIVGGHIGYPWTQEMIALATKYPNVHIDTSAYKPSRYPPELVAYMQRHGRRKVLFGSNFPMIQPAECTAQLDRLGLDDEARALFVGGNAARVFDLPHPTTSSGP